MPAADVIAILEDHPDRVAAMRAVLAEVLPRLGTAFFATAPAMLDWLPANLHRVALIGLDHDLDSFIPRSRQATDPGCGRDMADFLAARPPVCPVIVHTTNQDAAVGMVRVLGEAGWPVFRVYPYDGEDWIVTDWADDLWDLQRRGWIAG